MSILVPHCVTQFTAGASSDKVQDDQGHSKESLVTEVVRKVASTSMDYSLARACASAIDLELTRAATKS